jgi:hypothetical protein
MIKPHKMKPTRGAGESHGGVVDHSGWGFYEQEVGHYFQHEPGAKGVDFAGAGGAVGSDPKPPQFPPGADYWTMMTVADRLPEADIEMPCVGVQVATVEEEHTDGKWRTRQIIRKDGRPSASMVLRARYGTLACKYDDSAPNGAKLLVQAQAAYVLAARRVPARIRPTLKERLLAQWDRAFGGRP